MPSKQPAMDHRLRSRENSPRFPFIGRAVWTALHTLVKLSKTEESKKLRNDVMRAFKGMMYTKDEDFPRVFGGVDNCRDRVNQAKSNAERDQIAIA